jgi:hypothetical protein
VYSFSFRHYRDGKPVRDDGSHQKTDSSLLTYKRHLQVRKRIIRCERVSAKRSAEQDRSFSNEQLWRMVDNRNYHSISGRAHDSRDINYRWKCRCCTPYADPPHMLAVTEHPNLWGPFVMLVELAGGTHSALCRWLRRACPPCKVQDLSSYTLNVVTVELLMNR